MGYLINIMYGETATIKRFRFIHISNEPADDKFDEAVKNINKIYKEQGRFKTQEEILSFFRSYGFIRIAL